MGEELKYIEILAARSTLPDVLEAAQDGGATTSILLAGIESGLIDTAIVMFRDDDWHSIPGIAKSKEELLKAAGSKYIYMSPVAKLREAVKDENVKGIGFTGTPCMIKAAGAIERAVKEAHEKIRLKICLFCTHSWDWKEMKAILDELGVDIKDVTKMDIKGKFLFHTKDGKVYEYPLDKAEERSRPGCKLCLDFYDPTADLAIGAIGSPKEWNTIIILTERGKEFVEKAKELGYIETKPVTEKGINLIKRFVKMKKEEAEKHRKK